MHSQQVDWFRHDQINIFVSNFNVNTVNTTKTRLYSVKFKSKLVKLTGNLGYVDTVDTCMLEIPSRVDVGKDQRVNQVRLANYANELFGK